METKAITNNFAQGMTNIPSDAICPDDTTSAEYNLIFKDGEHKPIQAPVNAFEGQVEESRELHQLIYVHNYNNVKRCIFYSHKDNFIRWSFYDDVDTFSPLLVSFKIAINEINGITSIGNTLIISLSTPGYASLHYFLWKTAADSSNYTYLGPKLPNIEMDMHLNANDFGGNTFFKAQAAKFAGIAKFSETGETINGNPTYLMEPNSDKEEDLKALLIGIYSNCKNEIAKDGFFCLPFFARYALRLFDGSYTRISAPQLMFVCVRRNMAFYKESESISTRVYGATIVFRQKTDLSDWRDIINGVSIFITNPVEVNDTSSITLKSLSDISLDMVAANIAMKDDGDINYDETNTFHKDSYKERTPGNIINGFKLLSDGQIIRELMRSSVFYKIVDLGTNAMSKYEPITRYLNVNDLLNLTTLPQLDHDDYYSNCPISSNNLFMYNKRLHLSNIKRGYYTELNSLIHLMSTEKNITPYVYIKTPSGDFAVKCKKYNTYDSLTLYFYYPDPRAYKVKFIEYYTDTNTNEDKIRSWTLDLKPHPLLNGAYYLNSLPSSGFSDGNGIEITEGYVPKDNSRYEELQNEVWVSEVNNPFVFNASGVNTVGNGSIIGMISNTTALSQGQFGQFPLICFTTDGIYALEVASTGIYSSAHPLSREVCNNPNSIVATDHLVFFSSEKGLMMINGSQVTCVSENLAGKTFYPTPKEYEVMAKYEIGMMPSLIDFLRKSMIAYDYRDNLLWIMNPNHKLCYVLSIDNGAYAITTLPYTPVAVVNDYPDTIIELKTDNTEEFSGEFYNIYKSLSLINRPNINDDERRIDGFIFSRPMKLGDSLALKSPTDIRLIEKLNKIAGIRIRLFASEDLINWSRVNSLRGRGFKYFKYNLIFEDMLPTDTISGIVSRWQYRYQNKLR